MLRWAAPVSLGVGWVEPRGPYGHRPKKALWSVTVDSLPPLSETTARSETALPFAGPRTVTLPATTGTDCHVVPSYETRTRSDFSCALSRRALHLDREGLLAA